MSKKSTAAKRTAGIETAVCFEKIYFLTSLFLILFVADAHAYIDPGTGSYIIQLVIAGLLAAAYFLKMYWIKVIGLFKNLLIRPQKGKN